LRRKARKSNICLTWEAELAQLLPSEATSKSCDKPLTQVEAIVLHPCLIPNSVS